MKIAIASGKGGTGKTTLSTNLASYMAESGPVVLSDLDVEEPNSGLFLKQGQERESRGMFRQVPSWNRAACTLCGECQAVCRFNSLIKMGDQVMVFPELCHSCFACSELCPAGALPMVPLKMGVLSDYRFGSLSFVESRLEIGQEQAVPLIADTLAYIDEHYADTPLKLYDSPPGTSCPVIEAVKDADYVILVTEPTPFGLHDLTLAVETVRGLGISFGVVINRYGIGNADVEAYCARESIPVLAKLPNRRGIAELYAQGRLVYPHVPDFAAELAKIAAFLLEGGEEK